MAKFFTGQMVRENPDYIIFIKDAKGKNFRHDLYEDYKATREKMPDNLKSQIQDIENMVELMNIEIIAIPGYEADDVIATLAKKYDGNEKYDIDILS
jgi:DNA polymerase-1